MTSVHPIQEISAKSLQSNSDVESLLQSFLVSIVALTQAEAGVVRVLTDDGKFLRLVAQTGLSASVLANERLVGSDCGLCGSAATTDQIAWVSEKSACSMRDAAGHFGPNCERMLVISLAHNTTVLGVYNLFFADSVALEPQTENILRLIGRLLGQTLFEARMQKEHLRLSVMKERQEMVNEVHDAIAQTLYYVRMRLPLLQDAMLAHEDEASLKYFADVKTAVGEVHDNLREVMTYFRTRMDPLGLLHAVRGIAETYEDRTGIQLSLNTLPEKLDLTDAQEIQVFHIIQEALANVVKHARARQASVTFQQRPGEIEVFIEDDGLGLATANGNGSGSASRAGHMGMEIMQSRAQRLGGQVTVTPSLAGGVKVHLRIPVVAPQGAFE